MKALRIILIVLLVLFGVFVIVNAALPKNVQVSRERVMDDSPEAIFAQISDVNNWKNWSMWYEIDQEATYEYSDPGSGEGAWYSWESENPNLGKGKLTIVEVTPSTGMKTRIEFEGKGRVDGTWELTETEEGTKVFWSADMEFPFFQRWVGIWVGMMMDGALGPQFEGGLANIDSVASAMGAPAAEADYGFEETTLDEMMVYYVMMENVPMSEISTKMGESFGVLMNWLGEDSQNMSAPPMAEYTEWDEETSMCSFRTLISAETDKAPSAPVMEGTLVGGRCLKGTYMGSYDEMDAIYNAAFEHIAKMGWEMVGGPLEVYMTDPGMEPDTSKWITDIYWPIGDAGDNTES
ncbi:MAG: SRPBCC family protein [Flavobacteriales bacterium]|nr:SRPBCC family protein [Flavobacteriales bacterium]